MTHYKIPLYNAPMGFWKPQKKNWIEQTAFNKYTNFIPELQRIVTPESTTCKKKARYTSERLNKTKWRSFTSWIYNIPCCWGVILLPCGG